MVNYKGKNFKDFIRDGSIKLKLLIGKHLMAPLQKKINSVRYNHLAPTDKTIYINIDDIYGWCPGSLKGLSYQGQVLSGDWDLNIIPKNERLKTFSKYIGIYERYIEQKEWIETTLFQHYKSLLKKNRQVLGRNSIKEIEAYYEENIDSLFTAIKTIGILPAGNGDPGIDPLYVHIGRNGEFFYTVEGNHRLSMAIVLNIEKIPVQVWKRHKLWQEKREKILGDRLIPKNLKKYLNHPDIISELNSSDNVLYTKKLAEEIA
ncbi:hypothetical protein [Rhodohalobacter barkolensis]|uniref:ParB/Sulfiredoxin domain-containing protein n=1 Tax=Rhodohalobacter barkolensis TaxID=2053187 RepID=A0A2N0VGC3_9BACT|nr:hypothetical protein [Rhodohalobacter barkolensis]PKD43255.1 hypothetical protein CWD77_11615 [Rhodohalobacter barkolensis]